jgi:hypothetical protein
MSKKTEPKKDIPPQPEIDPMLGDKTFAYVEWLRDYHPEEFQSRYAGRTTHLGFVNPDGTLSNIPGEI